MKGRASSKKPQFSSQFVEKSLQSGKQTANLATTLLAHLIYQHLMQLLLIHFPKNTFSAYFLPIREKLSGKAEFELSQFEMQTHFLNCPSFLFHQLLGIFCQNFYPFVFSCFQATIILFLKTLEINL